MDYLYSLYDALVSINVPNDKARAVVDAMERDMATNLATKADLALLETKLNQSTELLRKDMQLLESRLKIWLGSIQVGTLGIFFVALKLTGS
jgi:hypothetical protein